MDYEIMQELIDRSEIKDDTMGVDVLLGALEGKIDPALIEAIDNAIDRRVSEMQDAAFLAGHRAGATALDLQLVLDGLNGDLDELRTMLRDARRRHDKEEVAELVALRTQKRSEIKKVKRDQWGRLPGYVKFD